MVKSFAAQKREHKELSKEQFLRADNRGLLQANELMQSWPGCKEACALLDDLAYTSRLAV